MPSTGLPVEGIHLSGYVDARRPELVELGGLPVTVVGQAENRRTVGLMYTQTSTFAKYAVAALANCKSLGERGYYEGRGQLQPESDNPVDPQAVAGVVDGERVSCLPSYAAKNLLLPAGASEPVRYQLHVQRDQKLLAKAYVWLGDDERAWQFTAQNPPALTSRERINSSHGVDLDGQGSAAGRR